ncbi:MAG: signal transduction histidine kinase [Flavobacteriaceae bacterium]|jgi:signal transduction histidine kinase
MEQKNDHCTEALETKSQLISMSAHQIRTNLSAFKWGIQMLADGDFGTINDEQKIFLEQSQKSVADMIDIISEMLRVNHAEGASISYNFTTGTIDTVLDQALSQFKHAFKKKGVTLDIKRDTLPEIKFDKAHMRIVFENLIDNALKYTHSGGVVFIRSCVNKTGICWSIHDTGIGIPKDESDKVFRKFYRAKNAQESGIVGTGLGLYSSREIIQAHGGTLYLEECKKGTNISFSLPLIAKETE